MTSTVCYEIYKTPPQHAMPFQQNRPATDLITSLFCNPPGTLRLRQRKTVKEAVFLLKKGKHLKGPNKNGGCSRFGCSALSTFAVNVTTEVSSHFLRGSGGFLVVSVCAV